MKGYYLRYRCPSVQPLQDLVDWMAQSDIHTFYACQHEDFMGDVVLEIASLLPCRGLGIQSFPVTSIEFFGEALVEAGGVCVVDGEVVEHQPRPEAWRRCMGLLTHTMDDVDVYHPRGLHASDYAKFSFLCH